MTETKTDLQKEVLDKFAQELGYENFSCMYPKEYDEDGCENYEEDENVIQMKKLVALALEMGNKDTIAKLETLYEKGFCGRTIIDELKKEQEQGVKP